MDNLTTEQRNQNSTHLDEMTAEQIVALMNQEDMQVAPAVGRVADEIAWAIRRIAETFQRHGRLVYVGAGTSGRLGVLDASECPPTFSTPPEMVVGIIAGGFGALVKSAEGIEDHPELAVADLQKIDFSKKDILVGIATSGRTPYVLGALDYARDLGAVTVGITCNSESELHGRADKVIAPIVGPEVLSGSTRLKAGTATKMVLNMLSTGAMVLIGKTFGNLMVDLRATNSKLKTRSIRIVREITGVSESEAVGQLNKCEGEVKTAILSLLANIDIPQARNLLQHADGHLRTALRAAQQQNANDENEA